MNKIIFDKPQTSLMISGAVGYLEAVVHKPQHEVGDYVAVVCHPHPLYQGTMDNKVVTTLARLFCDRGYYTVRFNFRGVGRSEGLYDQAIGEVDDLLAVLQWAQTQFPNRQFILSGFSFGSFIAAQGALQIEAAQLVLVAPPVHDFPFRQLAEFTCPWIVIQGEQDEIVPADEVVTWCRSRRKPPHLILMAETSHFFHARLTELREKLVAALGK